MNIRFVGGVRNITLTKGELATLNKATDLCRELGEQLDDSELGKAAGYIDGIASRYAAKPAKSEPEAAAT